MSWSEVKKINSNLDVPLDEMVTTQFNKIPKKKKNRMLTTTPSTTNWETILEVKGSGLLHDCFLRRTIEKAGIKVTIDGIIYAYFKNSSTNIAAVTGIVNTNSFCVSDGAMYFLKPYMANNLTSSQNSPTQLSSALGSTRIYRPYCTVEGTLGVDCSYFVPTTYPIPFNNGFKVEAISNYSYMYIDYELDE